ncbi:MAG TPA: ParB-like protein [Beijerinckiaceae bacterium]|nr:ParB-like protein [Beijerinckiaceae bacterium]
MTEGPEASEKLVEVDLGDLRPTQMTVGLSEVRLKRQEWRGRDADGKKHFLKKNPLPAVFGPKKRYYITDHHHLGRALREEKVKTVYAAVLSDFSHLQGDEFWVVMDNNRWVHAYDANGRRRQFVDIPKKLSKLTDDPYRSLAWEVRRLGDYPKDTTPYSEFLWADYFRRRISASLLTSDHADALEQACALARLKEARHLPDWSETA